MVHCTNFPYLDRFLFENLGRVQYLSSYRQYLKPVLSKILVRSVPSSGILPQFLQLQFMQCSKFMMLRMMIIPDAEKMPVTMMRREKTSGRSMWRRSTWTIPS